MWIEKYRRENINMVIQIGKERHVWTKKEQACVEKRLLAGFCDWGRILCVCRLYSEFGIFGVWKLLGKYYGENCSGDGN